MNCIYQHCISCINCVTSGNDILQIPLTYNWVYIIFQRIYKTILVLIEESQEKILSRLNDFYTDGVGYSDVVGIVAIPLIIALFAFSFPFVFDRINQINNKYQSKILSNLFSSFLLYKLFWKVSFLCIAYILVYGVCTLFYKHEVLVTYAVLWNCLSIFVAATYALIVWLFAKRTVKYNNPDQLLVILDSVYKYERRKLIVNSWLLKTKIDFKYLCHSKDYSIFKSTQKKKFKWNDKVPDLHYVCRLKEITRYAIKQDDFELFQNILNRLDNFIEREKWKISNWNSEISVNSAIQEGDVHSLTMDFFMDMMLDFSPFSRGYMSNEAIVFKMIGAFNKSMYLSHNDGMYLAVCLRRMIDKNNKDLIFKYINYTSYYFNYIRYLPRVHYIKGGNLNECCKVESLSHESWNNLIAFHYAALAYGFGLEKFYLLHIHFKSDICDLYPNTGTDVLIRYVLCKAKSLFLKNEILLGKYTDIHTLLARYTSALIMILPKKYDEHIRILENIAEYIKDIEKERAILKKGAEFVKSNKKITTLYPYVKNVDFEERLDFYIKQLKSSNDLTIMKQNDANKKKANHCLITKIFSLFNLSQDKKVTRMDLYKMPSDKKLLYDFKKRFVHFDKDIERYIPRNLFDNNKSNRIEKISVNSCQILVHKLLFLDADLYYLVDDFYYEFVKTISNRILYLALCVFRKMRIQEKTLLSLDFDLFFEKFTHGKKDDYVLIGIGGTLDSTLNISYQDNHQAYYKKTVPYIYIDAIGTKHGLYDLENYEYFKNSILIIAKTDLPTLLNSSKENVSVKFQEESDGSQMKMNIRTTVNVHKDIYFNNMAEIIVVRFKSMS